MAQTARAAAEQFARASDQLLQGTSPELLGLATDAPELALAAALHASGRGIPDPAFVEGLRAVLRVRAAGALPAAVPVRYGVLDTEVGRLALAWRQGKVVMCSALADGGESAEEGFRREVTRAFGVLPERTREVPATIAGGVHDHLAGKRRFKDVDLSWLKPFQRRVLEKTAEIPRGEVRPYAWIAREIGAPGATRAVGTALGHNPIPFIIPCHRVVRADGSLGEYSGGGPVVKERVLDWEGVSVRAMLSAAGRGERYRASRTTGIVCYPTCHAARRIQEANVVPFASLERAQAAGYRPCKLCRPA